MSTPPLTADDVEAAAERVAPVVRRTPLERDERLTRATGADVWLKLGNIHYRRGAQDEARASWERALAIDPENVIVRGNLGVARANQTPLAEAAQA